MAQSISFQDAVSLAESGDAEAQYALSSLFHQRGQFEESLHWLRQAASREVIPARMTLATFLIDGRACTRDAQQALDLLRPLADTQVQANLLLAELHGFDALGIGNPEMGLRYLSAAARMGDGGALRQLALLAVCHHRWELVRSLLDASARRGDSAAAYALACCYAGGMGGGPAPAFAMAISRSNPARRHRFCERLEQHLSKQNPRVGAAAPPVLPIDWTRVEQSLPHLGADIPLPSAHALHDSPLIRRLPGVLPPLVLDALIAQAAPLVRRSQIVDARTGEARADPMRNSSHVTLGPRQHDHMLEAIERCIRHVTGLPARNAEFLQILRYRPGEEFKPHVDYFNESGAGAHRSLAAGGQRAQTVLLYLNDDYAGGGTCFPTLDLLVEGRAGDMLHFHNLGTDGMGHRDSLHAGMPVTAGEKWLASQWIRSAAHPARVAW